MPIWKTLSFQDSFSPEMESINFFHDFSMILVIFVCLISGYFIFSSFFLLAFDNMFLESHELELFWTVSPGSILLLLALPSMKVLYFSEDPHICVYSFKVSGHQWYWSYESFQSSEEMDSFLESSYLSRLLKISNVLNLPSMVTSRVLFTSEDVIHSWSVPSLGMKVDCTPGRLSQAFMSSKVNSMVVGQCSEICGANHSFMPIVLIFSNN